MKRTTVHQRASYYLRQSMWASVRLERKSGKAGKEVWVRLWWIKMVDDSKDEDEDSVKLG